MILALIMAGPILIRFPLYEVLTQEEVNFLVKEFVDEVARDLTLYAALLDSL